MEKKCRKCQVILSEDNWSKSRRQCRNNLCSPCGRVQDLYYRERNRAKYNSDHVEYMKKRLADPQKRDEYNAYFRAYVKRRRAADPSWTPKAKTNNRYHTDPEYREKIRVAARAYYQKKKNEKKNANT